jgi:hypothetical protein
MDMYDHLMSTKIFTLIIRKIFMSSENYGKSGYSLDFEFANYLTLIAYFIF